MKTRIKKGIYLLTHNPRLLPGILYDKLCLLWPLPKSPALKKTNGVVFEYDFTYDLALKEMYRGIYERKIVKCIKKYLRKGGVFIDVGANIGYLSMIGLGAVGISGQVHSFEPVPRYFEKLSQFAGLNKDYKIFINQCALGEKEGSTKINVTNMPNIGWNTIVPNFMSKETIGTSIQIPVYRLDDYIQQKQLSNIDLIKIDTEGFEFPVLKGLSGYFDKTNFRPAILCEIAPGAYPLLGYTLSQLSEYMKHYNYRAFSITDNKSEIDITTLKDTTNVIFKV